MILSHLIEEYLVKVEVKVKIWGSYDYISRICLVVLADTTPFVSKPAMASVVLRTIAELSPHGVVVIAEQLDKANGGIYANHKKS